MKRILAISIFLAVIATVARAGEKPFFDTSRTDDFIEVELHALGGATSVGQNYADCIEGLNEMYVSPGVGLGAGASVRFVIRDFLALGTQFDFRINNNRYEMTLVTPSERTSSLYLRNHFYDINIPLFMSFRFNIADNVKWYVDGGIFFSLGFGGYQKADIYNTYVNSLGQMITAHVSEEHEYFGDEFPIIHNVADFDVGLHLASGFVFSKHYTVGVSLQLGLRDLAKNTAVFTPAMRNRSCLFKLGYVF